MASMVSLKQLEYQRKYRIEHREQMREYWRQRSIIPQVKERKNLMNTIWRQTHKNERNQSNKIWYFNNKEHHNKMLYHTRETARLKTMRRYSPDLKCAKCGFSDTRALSFDHINGGGRKHRKEVGGRIWYWLIKNNYPDGYQILCMNCQFIKRTEQREFFPRREMKP